MSQAPSSSYFFMKVGYSNSLLGHALEEGLAGRDTALWVGYQDNSVQGLLDAMRGDREAWSKIPSDLRYLAVASQQSLTASSVRVLTFSGDSLLVWRICGPLRSAGPREVDALLGRYQTDPNFLACFKIDPKTATDSDIRGHLSSKALPVRLEARIKRALLPACIDSLSVYRSLNSGTFRYLCPTKGASAEELLGRIFPPRNAAVLQPGEREWTETPFARFVADYLDWLLDASLTEDFATARGLTPEEVFTLTTAVMSPSQLETGAAMTAMSIGLTLDSGVGKGLDVVDVRASVRHRRSSAGFSKFLADTKAGLADLMGGKVAPEVLEALDITGSLELQCKNYTTSVAGLRHPSLVLFMPQGELNGRTITLASVRDSIRRHPGRLHCVEDWLSLAEQSYTQPKARRLPGAIV
jgi:hypothetical protein